MSAEIIDRYLYAVTKNLPRRARADIEQELRGAIADILEARCPGRLPAEADLRAVLAELGTPDALARQYGAREGRAFIGPLWYGAYKLALAVSLGAVALLCLISWAVDFFTCLGSTGSIALVTSPAAVLSLFFSWALPIFTAVTLVIALLDRLGLPGRRPQPADWVSALPPIPTEKARISRGESIVGVVGAAVMAVLMLNVPAFAHFFAEGGEPVYLLAGGADQRFILGGVLFFLLGGARHLFALMEGRYCTRYAVVSTAFNLLVGAVAYRSLCFQPFFSSGFTALVEGNAPAAFVPVLLHLNYLLFLIIFLSLVGDTIETVYRAARYGGR